MEPVVAERYRVEIVTLDYYRGVINCQNACPVHTDAEGYVNAIADGDYQRGYIIARQPNPFVSTCGRVCVAPCETACRRGQFDAPIAIRALKRFLTERHGVEVAKPPQSWFRAPGPDNANTETSVANWSEVATKKTWAEAKGQRVAIIGGGPAGLTAAHDLALRGYSVTVFESLTTLGGIFPIAIPPYRLPRELVEREIQDILDLGIEIRTDTAIVPERDIEKLKSQGYAAVFIATGAERSRKLSKPQQGIFAEGDMVFGDVAIIHATSAGHRGAEAIDQYLRGSCRTVIKGHMIPVDSNQYLRPGWLEIRRRDPSVTTFAPGAPSEGIEVTYTKEEAEEQGRRCLRCHIQTVFNGDLCILCGGCVDVCPQSCYKMVSLNKIEGNASLESVVEARYGIALADFEKGGSDPNLMKLGTAMIKDETRCTRCGLCAQRCPTGAITMEAFYFEAEASMVEG
ncbi:MAG: 4Fe-4S binding protein [Chloroflexi bacterium]|nr:4Fe-4S binding protein [Chloroflexota bacterium]